MIVFFEGESLFFVFADTETAQINILIFVNKISLSIVVFSLLMFHFLCTCSLCFSLVSVFKLKQISAYTGTKKEIACYNQYLNGSHIYFCSEIIFDKEKRKILR